MPLPPMGFLLSRGFPSCESVLLSESLPSCLWTDRCSLTLVRGPSRQAHCFWLALQPPFHKSARDCRGFPSPESVHLLAVLPVVQSRASRVLSDCNDHLLVIPSMLRAVSSSKPELSTSKHLRKMSLMRLDRPLPPKKQPLASSHQTANSSDGVRPGSDFQQAGIRLLSSHFGVARADPPSRHP